MAFQVRPQSVRLISPWASKAAFSLPHGSVATPLNSTSRVTGLVMPLMVRSPVSVRPSKEVLRNVISGWFSTSKKSALRR